MNPTAQPQATGGNKVQPINRGAMPPEVSDDDVKAAREALEGESGQVWPDAEDGRPKDKATSEQLAQEQEQKAEEAEKPKAVPKPNDEINQLIVDAKEEIDEIKAERKLLNAKINEITERLESKGINRHAFRYACKVLDMDESQREGLDLSYALVRQAGGQPIQSDWVED